MSTTRKTKNLRLRRKMAGIVSAQRKMDLQLDSILRDIKKLNKIITKLK